VQLVSNIFNLCGHDPPTSQTDRQTDDDMRRKTWLRTIVHQAVKTAAEDTAHAAGRPDGLNNRPCVKSYQRTRRTLCGVPIIITN